MICITLHLTQQQFCASNIELVDNRNFLTDSFFVNCSPGQSQQQNTKEMCEDSFILLIKTP